MRIETMPMSGRSPLEGELSNAHSRVGLRGLFRASVAGVENPHPAPQPRKRGYAADRPLKGGGGAPA
jgi:hypothetical protein